MGRFIVKLMDGAKPYYLEWSTVIDAPVTYGMSLREFREYYRARYGSSGMEALEKRMERVHEKGTSAMIYESAEDVVGGYNRAGDGETCLTVEQVIAHYCRTQKSVAPRGHVHPPDDNRTCAQLAAEQETP